ncbi:unnamed protein product [Linum grandiflorum]
MADHRPTVGSARSTRPPTAPSLTTAAATTSSSHPTTSAVAAFLHRLQTLIQRHAPGNTASTQLIGLLTLLITASILLLLTGATVAVFVLSLIFLAPILLVFSPIWVPVATLLFVLVTGFLTFAGFVVAMVGGLSWGYRYYRGMNPVGSDRFDYARERISDTAGAVKEYAREYGGYFQSKVKDAAPGA